MVEEFVEAEEAAAGGAVDVVPPIADEVLLIEDGAVGAQEGVEVAVELAHVKHLKIIVHSFSSLSFYLHIDNANNIKL